MNTDTLDTETRTKLARILRHYAQGLLDDAQLYHAVCDLVFRHTH